MKRTTIFFLLPVLLMSLVTSAFARQAREATPPLLIANGNAQVEASPDEATVRLGIVAQQSTAQAVQEQVNRIAQAILAEMTKLGIPAARIRTSRLTVTPVYAPLRPESREGPRIVNYNASNQVAVEVTNLDQIGPVIDAGLRAGANNIEGVQFRLKNDLPMREQALKLAVGEARRKAEVMAEALGVILVSVHEVSESGFSILPKGEAEGGFVMQVRAATPTPVSPGQLEVTANVTVKYVIRGR